MDIKKGDIFDILSTVADFAILIVDGQGTVRSATPAVRKIFQKQEGEIEGNSLANEIPMLEMLAGMEFTPVDARGGIALLDDSDADSANCQYLEYLASHEESEGHFETECTINDSNRWLELATYKLLQNEKIIFAVIIQDITKRKQDEIEIRDLNENLEKRVEDRTQQIKQVVQSCSQELAHVNETYQNLKNQIMDFMEALEHKIIENTPSLNDIQKQALKTCMSNENMELMNWFSQDQITDQKFLITINSLKELFEGKCNTKDNLRPEQMGGTSQDDVDDLLDSLGI